MKTIVTEINSGRYKVDQKRIAVIGGGRLGKSLAFQLKASGHFVTGIACRTAASAAKAADLTGIASNRAAELAATSDVIFITTPDDLLQEVCERLVQSGAIDSGTTVLHCSGAKPSNILQAAQTEGAVIASLHPLQSFSGFNPKVNPFLNINFTVEGDPSAIETATKLALDLGAARCYPIDTAGKALYHAAAVAASNYLVTLFNMAAALLAQSGIAKDDAFAVLAPLLNGTMQNLADRAPYYEMALTGPISRGDVQVVASHLEVLQQAAKPELFELYRALGRATVKVAEQQGSLAVARSQKLLKILT